MISRISATATFSHRRHWAGTILGLVMFLQLLPGCFTASAEISVASPGSRTESKPWLAMPPHAGGALPPHLSQTGAFKDVPNLVPGDNLIPYDLIVSFWSDGAEKSRWVSVPSGGKIKFAPTGEWIFPPGTVFVKNFELATDETNPTVRRRLETRLLVCD